MRRQAGGRLARWGLLFLVLIGMSSQADSPSHIGYGVNPAYSGDSGIADMGFEWAKVFGSPAGRLPYRVLRRVHADGSTLGELSGWGAELENTARTEADWIEAWEIGNEPNLDADYGWNAPPSAADYTQVLCEAYRRIKGADQNVMVVSAGLAPTGRIPFTWNGHQGYCAEGVDWCAGYYQDEREFLREMLHSGAGECFDALGYHPYGFAAPYDAAPGSADCGANDFCFRGVEAMRDIMLNEFRVDKPIWATEFGWIIDPDDAGRPECLGDPSLAGRQWQFVSQQEQAENLLGAYEWAEANYAWMGPMFLFNYGFYSYPSCDQMGFYDIKGRAAEESLRSMSKNIVPARYEWSGLTTFWSEVSPEHPLETRLTLQNHALEPLGWSASIASSPFFTLTLDGDAGSFHDPLHLSVDPDGLNLGVYTGTLVLTVTNALPIPVEEPVQNITITLRMVEKVWRVHLPLITSAG